MPLQPWSTCMRVSHRATGTKAHLHAGNRPCNGTEARSRVHSRPQQWYGSPPRSENPPALTAQTRSTGVATPCREAAAISIGRRFIAGLAITIPRESRTIAGRRRHSFGRVPSGRPPVLDRCLPVPGRRTRHWNGLPCPLAASTGGDSSGFADRILVVETGGTIAWHGSCSSRHRWTYPRQQRVGGRDAAGRDAGSNRAHSAPLLLLRRSVSGHAPVWPAVRFPWRCLTQ